MDDVTLKEGKGVLSVDRVYPISQLRSEGRDETTPKGEIKVFYDRMTADRP
jgi:hypothetical protein